MNASKSTIMVFGGNVAHDATKLVIIKIDGVSLEISVDEKSLGLYLYKELRFSSQTVL